MHIYNGWGESVEVAENITSDIITLQREGSSQQQQDAGYSDKDKEKLPREAQVHADDCGDEVRAEITRIRVRLIYSFKILFRCIFFHFSRCFFRLNMINGMNMIIGIIERR